MMVSALVTRLMKPINPKKTVKSNPSDEITIIWLVTYHRLKCGTFFRRPSRPNPNPNKLRALLTHKKLTQLSNRYKLFWRFFHGKAWWDICFSYHQYSLWRFHLFCWFWWGIYLDDEIRVIYFYLLILFWSGTFPSTALYTIYQHTQYTVKRGISPTAMKFFLTKFVRGVPHHFEAFLILFSMQEKNLKKKSFYLESGRLKVSYQKHV